MDYFEPLRFIRCEDGSKEMNNKALAQGVPWKDILSFIILVISGLLHFHLKIERMFDTIKLQPKE